MSYSNNDSYENKYYRAKEFIKRKTSYYRDEIEELKKKRDTIKYSGHITENEKKDLKNIEEKIVRLIERANAYTKDWEKTNAKFTKFEKGLEREKPHLRVGDYISISNFEAVLGENTKISRIFGKEGNKLYLNNNKLNDKFRDDKNADRIIDDNGISVIGGNSHEIIQGDVANMLMEEYYGKVDELEPEEMKEEDIKKEYEQILRFECLEYGNIDKVTQPENEFNFSEKDIKDLNRSKELYEEVAKHKQIIKKIDEVLERFGIGIDEKDPKYNDFRGRKKDFPRFCEKLQKMKEKELKKIAKLEKKAEVAYNRCEVYGLSELVDSRNTINEKKAKLEELNNTLEKLESEKKKLETDLIMSSEMSADELEKKKKEFYELLESINDCQTRKGQVENEIKEAQNTEEELSQKHKKYVTKLPATRSAKSTRADWINKNVNNGITPEIKTPTPEVRNENDQNTKVTDEKNGPSFED